MKEAESLNGPQLCFIYLILYFENINFFQALSWKYLVFFNAATSGIATPAPPAI